MTETSKPHLQTSLDELNDVSENEIVLRVHQEQLNVDKQMIVTGSTQVRVTTHTELQSVQVPLTEKKVKVEVTPVNQFVDHVPTMQKQANVTTIPVYEERVVTVKKIFLKEMITIIEETTQNMYMDEIELKKQESNISFKKFNEDQ